MATLEDILTKIRALPGFLDVTEITPPGTLSKSRMFEVIMKIDTKTITIEQVSVFVATDGKCYVVAPCIVCGNRMMPDNIQAAIDALKPRAEKVRTVFYDSDENLAVIERYILVDGALVSENYKIYVNAAGTVMTTR